MVPRVFWKINAPLTQASCRQHVYSILLYTAAIKDCISFNIGYTLVGPDSAVGIASRYGLEVRRPIPVGGQRLSAPVQTDPGAHPASYTMGTGSYPAVNSRAVALTTHPNLAPRLKKE